MARREYKLQKRCAHEGCSEIGRWTYDTVADLRNSLYQRHEYRCIRHKQPESVLSAENAAIEVVMVSRASDVASGLYWNGTSGFQYGPGFKAWANDFPEGTRLIITARIESPEQTKTAAA